MKTITQSAAAIITLLFAVAIGYGFYTLMAASLIPGSWAYQAPLN